MSLQIVPPRPRNLPVLTADQEAAATPTEGVTVVVGGPGTGKSSVAVAAAVRRVEAGSRLDRVVLLTHSRAAAQGLRRDVVRRLGGSHINPQVTTVHGLSLGLLRRFWPHTDSPWRLLRAPEQEQRIRELLEGMPVDSWPESVRAAVGTRAFARQLREVLARARQLSLDAESLAAMAHDADDPVFAAAAGFMEGYLTVGDFSGTLDYSELVYRTRLLITEPDVGAGIAAAFDAIIVDDAQEADQAQVGLLADLARLGLPILALGDPQQRIGGYRGASRRALYDLARLPGARNLILREGHRNAPPVEAALRRFASRLDGGLPAASTPADTSAAVRVRIFDDEAAELAAVASELRAAVVHDDLRWEDLVVIARAGRTQVSAIAKELIRLGVPVDVAGDEIALAEQPVVATLLMALGVAAAGGVPCGDESRLLLSSPLCGLDGTGQRQLGRQLLERHRTLGTSDVLLSRAFSEPTLLEGIESEAAEQTRRLGAVLRDAAALIADGAQVQEVLWQLWDSTPWPGRLRDQALRGSRRANADLDAVIELFELAARMPQLRGKAGARTFQAEVSGQEIPADTGRELDLGGRGVRVVTAHRTRGLEWEAAWVVGVQEGLWPRLSRAGVLLDPDRLGAEELSPRDSELVPAHVAFLTNERQLFYVACSRARSRLTVSAVQGIEGEGGRPSRFLGELGVEPERVHGRPPQLLSVASLVGRLRQRLLDPESSSGLRRAAATRLAGLAAIVTADGRAAFPGAAPAHWWGVWGVTPERVSTREVVITGSALDALLGCPRRWFLSRRALAEGGRQSRASIGDVVHLLARQTALEGLSANALHERLAAVWDKISFETEWLSATERVEIDAAIDRFHRYHRFGSGELLGVEVPFRVTVSVAGRPITLVGTVDRLERDFDGRLRIVDLKTGRRPLTDTAAASHPQLGLYQLAARSGAFDALAPGERRVAPPALAFLRSGETLPQMVSQPSLDDQPRLAGEELVIGPTWMHDKLYQAAQILDGGRFDAIQSSACRYCQFCSSCPAIAPTEGRR